MIIVTRPSPYGEELTRLCNEANLSAKHLPLFSIEKGHDVENLQFQLNILNKDDLVISTSPQVAHFIVTANKPIDFPHYVNYFAIGKKSAALFQQLCKQSVRYPDNEENSEGLITYFNNMKLSVSGRQILILCGNNGRQIIKRALESKNGIVKNSYIYKRKPIDYPHSILNEHHPVKKIIVTSVEHLIRLELYCQQEQKSKYLLIASGDRIANKAIQLGWKNIYLSQNANNQNLFKTISTLCHNAQ